ncbi:MAG: metal ABC transporter permease [Phycisphaerales bacterium]|nr:metal ABC transporter permease [Phycisphaerales bacterium]MCI0677397.1 metal ABC transporter permease [Phycisphaerales bacterium]
MSGFLTQDFPVLMAGLLASLACALIGSFLVLRRMSLMGDAISHAVLPGIVGAFLLHWWLDQRGIDANLSLIIFGGAVVIGVLTAGLSELVHRLGRVEPGASMGVVFTVLFAIGVIMLQQTGGDQIHMDADCVLYGLMESVLWINPPTSLGAIFSAASWEYFPRQITMLLVVLAFDAAFVIVLFKELRITSFDPDLAAAQGVNPSLMHYLLMTFVAMTTVAAFEAVGSILVVAMLIVPGMVAHLLTDRLSVMLGLSAAVAVIASISGYTASAALNVNAAGMIGVALGVVLALAALFSPRHGVISRLRQRRFKEVTT